MWIRRTGCGNFQGDDLNLLTVMANVAAIRIERERLAELEHARRRMASELEQAAEIQQPVSASLRSAGSRLWNLPGSMPPAVLSAVTTMTFLPIPTDV